MTGHSPYGGSGRVVGAAVGDGFSGSVFACVGSCGTIRLTIIESSLLSGSETERKTELMRIRAKEIRRTRHRKEVRAHAARQLAGTATPTPARVATPAPRPAAARPPRERKPKAEETKPKAEEA